MKIEGVIYSILFAILGLFIISRIWKTHKTFVLVGAFSIKMVGAYVLTALFTYYYTDQSTSDIWRFFNDGLILKEVFFNNPSDFFRILFNLDYDSVLFREIYFDKMNSWNKPFESSFYNDNHIMIKINALIALFSFGFVEVHSVVFSILGFVGLLLLIDSLIPIQYRSSALILTCFYPSWLIWISGGLKETLLIFGAGLFISGIWRFEKKNPLISIIKMSVGGLTLISVKIYFVAFLIPALLAYQIGRQFKYSALTMICSWLLLVSCCFMIFSTLVGNPAIYIASKQQEFITHTQFTNPGSGFSMKPIEPELTSLVKQAPIALMNTILKPFPWAVSVSPEWLMVLENLYLFFLMLLSAYGIRKYPINYAWPLWLLFLIVPFLILTGTVTPVFGAIMRYRSPVILIFMISITPFIHPLIKKYFK
ncbi:MAG: hypothetical protein WEC59_05695 [Salibacteraceae bacterium]